MNSVNYVYLIHFSNFLLLFQFHFILNLAVGGNYFPDGCDNLNGAKPWQGQFVPGAMKSFWENRDLWYWTWVGEEAALKIDYIRVYQNVVQD